MFPGTSLFPCRTQKGYPQELPHEKHLIRNAFSERPIFVHILHDGPMSLAICRAPPHCQANIAQLWSSLGKSRGFAFLWRHGVCQSPRPTPPPRVSPSRVSRVWLRASPAGSLQSQACFHPHNAVKLPLQDVLVMRMLERLLPINSRCLQCEMICSHSSCF